MSAFIMNQINELGQDNTTQDAVGDCTICNNEKELAYVNRLKDKYGEQDWMWYVENTEEDCKLADRYREWFYKRGVTPDFDIHETCEGQTNRMEKEKKKQKYKIHYKMQGLYGDEWWWAVVNTEHDCELAAEHRRLDREKFREEDEQRRRDNF